MAGTTPSIAAHFLLISASYPSSADSYQQAVGQLVFREPFLDKTGEEAEQVAPTLHNDFSIRAEKNLIHIRS